MIKLSEDLKEKPLYITMGNASSTKLFQSRVSLATVQTKNEGKGFANIILTLKFQHKKACVRLKNVHKFEIYLRP